MENKRRKDRRISQYEQESSQKTNGKEQQQTENKREQTPKNGTISSDGFIKSKTGGGYRKAAKLLLLLGREDASRIMSHLSEEELLNITNEIANIRKVDPEESVKLLEEFGEIHMEHRLGKGGVEVALKMLTNAFGEERAKEVIEKTVIAKRQRPFDFLEDIESEQLISLLKNEPPSVLSTVLPYLEPSKAGAVLASLETEIQKQTVKRIASLTTISPDVLSKIEEALRSRLRTQGKIVTEEIDGSTVLAGILREMDYSIGEALLSELDETEPKVSEVVRKKVLTIDVVTLLADQDLQTVLRDFDDGEIAVILKGKTEKVKDRILNCVSARRRMIISEESIHLGSMRKSDVDKATGEFIDYIRDLERQNKIVIRKENDYFI